MEKSEEVSKADLSSSVLDNASAGIPNEFICPISKGIMEYPVIASDGTRLILINLILRNLFSHS